MKNSPGLVYVGITILPLIIGFLGGRMSVSPIEETQSSDEEGTALSAKKNPYNRSSMSTGSHVGRKGRKGSESESRSYKQTRRSMGALLHEMSNSPIVSMDYDSMFELWLLVRGMSEDEVKDSFGLLDGVKDKQLEMMTRMILMSRWGKLNGSEAIDFAMNLEGSRNRMMGAMGAMMSWVKEDPEAVYNWHLENGEKVGSGGMFDSMYEGMMWRSLASNDLDNTLKRIQDIEGKREQHEAYFSVAQAVVREPEKLKSFLAVLDQQGDSDLKYEVMRSAIVTLAQQDLDAAKSYILSIEDPEEKKKFTDSLVSSMSWSAPEEAITWGLEQATDEESKKEIIDSLLSNWVRNDPEKASAWYDSQPASLRSNDAVESTVKNLRTNGNYKSAFSWASRHQDQESAVRLKKKIYQSWLENSPEAAEAWVTGEGAKMVEGIDLDSPIKANGEKAKGE